MLAVACIGFTAPHASRMGSGRAAVSMTSISDFKATKIDGAEIDLSSFKGKPTLVMNVASL
jgi:cytochrome oxidase Cu insertion factor (SCO1/SenC/PrrC family)